MSITNKDIAAYVAQTSGLEADALASLVNEDGSFSETAGDILKKATEGFKGKLSSIETDYNSKFEATFDKRWKEGQAKLLDGREKKLRELLKIEGEVRGEELDKAILERFNAAKAKTGAPGTMDPDAIERSEFFQKNKEAWTKEKETAVGTIQQQFDAFKAEILSRDTFNGVWGEAVPKIEALNPKFDPDSETVRKDQWERIQEKLKAFNFERQEGRILVLDKEGKVAKDAMGNAVQFDALLTDIVTTTIGVKASEQRDGNGAKSDHQNKGDKATGWDKEYPKTQAEVDALMFDSSIALDKRLALKKWWDTNGKKAAA